MASSEDAAARVNRRKVAEESGRGAPLRDLKEHPFFFNGPNVVALLLPSSFFFRSGPNTTALLLPSFSVVAQIWLLGHISSCN